MRNDHYFGNSFPQRDPTDYSKICNAFLFILMLAIYRFLVAFDGKEALPVFYQKLNGTFLVRPKLDLLSNCIGCPVKGVI